MTKKAIIFVLTLMPCCSSAISLPDTATGERCRNAMSIERTRAAYVTGYTFSMRRDVKISEGEKRLRELQRICGIVLQDYKEKK